MKMTEQEKEKYLKLNVPKPVIIGDSNITEEEMKKYDEIISNVLKKQKRDKTE